MKVETKKTVTEQTEFPVPSFWANKTSAYSEYLGVLDEKTVCRIHESEWRTSVSNYDISLSMNELSEAFNQWERIGEDEFMTAYNRALHSLSLTPELSKETKII